MYQSMNGYGDEKNGVVNWEVGGGGSQKWSLAGFTRHRHQRRHVSRDTTVPLR